ncbi:ATP-binding protein [Wenyingzhuangia sp. chi5]|uniref:histidine kinase n=1 Tax=Wenyingzhuangia gilva TaxID=3057677 RepID=A0ABT8VUM4_9FLAO|nr:ATP-binding protein [Wenyingzhuangia sp. chi5]MDO3695666.1 ATP-binding protein [Wenyingzhuangia sp. chi5]
MKFFFLFFFILCNLSHAQENLLDTLEHYQNEVSITHKNLEFIVSEISSGTNIKDNERAASVERYLNFAKNHKNWDKAIILQNALANYYMYYKMNYEEIYNSLKKFKKYLPRIKNQKEIAKYYIAYAEVATFLQEYEASIEILNEAITNLHKDKDLIPGEYAYMYLKAGENSSKINNLIKSVTYFKEASGLFLSQNDTISYLWSQNGLSRLLGNNGLYDEAEKARDPIFKWKHKIPEIDVVVMAHITAAIEATTQNNKKKELYHVKQALLLKDKVFSELKNVIEIFMRACATYVYARHDLLKESDENLKELNQLMIGLEQNSVLNTTYMLARSQNAFAHKDYQQTKNYILAILETVRASKEPEKILDFEYLLAQAYQKTGETKKALHYFKNYINIKDSIQKSASRKRLAYVQNQFETEKKDLEILKQNNYISLLAAENRLKSQWILIGGIALISFFTILYLLRSASFEKRKQKLQKEFTQNILSSVENERKLIAMELHDSVGQQLMLLTRKAKKLSDSSFQELSLDTLTTIRSISHNLYPVVLKRLGFTEAAQSLINDMDENSHVFFTTEIAYIDEDLNEEQALHLYRILQEILQNIIKHAKAKSVFIKVSKSKEHIRLIIKDNGLGFNYNEISKTSKSLGLKFIEERCKIIQAKLYISSSTNEGTVVKIVL